MITRLSNENISRAAADEGATSGESLDTGKNITGKLANFSARRRWTILGAWAAALVAAFIVSGIIGGSGASASATNPNLRVGRRPGAHR
jgi:hypothetical protein